MWAVENDYIDLYTLIMFLVYEKKVLSFEDTKDKITFYMQDKFRKKMNEHLAQYKKKLSINYKPDIYEIITQTLGFTKIYIIAFSEKQATSYAFSQGYMPKGIKLYADLDYLMCRINSKGEEIYLTIRQLRDEAKEIPSMLGGY